MMQRVACRVNVRCKGYQIAPDGTRCDISFPTQQLGLVLEEGEPGRMVRSIIDVVTVQYPTEGDKLAFVERVEHSFEPLEGCRATRELSWRCFTFTSDLETLLAEDESTRSHHLVENVLFLSQVPQRKLPKTAHRREDVIVLFIIVRNTSYWSSSGTLLDSGHRFVSYRSQQSLLCVY